ncbi:MAG: hypothetical protein AAF573_09400 [Bacteroidota bacterium]
MNNTILTHGLRFVFLVLIQVLVFRQMTLGWNNFNFVHVIVYPVFIVLLPIRIPNPALIALGFLIGITVDLFYQSPGVHASATTLIAFLRPSILKLMTPRGGYNINHSPNIERFGFTWFAIFCGAMLIIHLFWYFIMSIFTHVYWLEIFLRAIFSFIVSFIIILLYVRIFNPKE